MTYHPNHENWLVDKREYVRFVEKASSMMNTLKPTTSCDGTKVARTPLRT